MIMKTTYNILMAGLLSALAFTSCEGFLDKFPETALSPETFYTNEKELTLATNGFYAMLPKPDDSFDGALQDNDLQFHLSLSSIQRGTRQAETETWSASTWSDLRSINYYLEHSVKCTNEDVRKKYDGIAYFFRAVFYYEKVRKYGDIPFYDHVISDSDKESLYRPRDSRGFVMQKIMEDLDRAIDGLPVSWSEGVYRINKYAAYALKSRIALFEGTWRKYHDIADESYTKEDGTTITLSSAYFLQLAADAAKAVMESGKYRMYNGATIVKGQPYRDYFVLEDAETSETILSRRFLYTAEMQIRHGVKFTYKNQRYSLTRALAYHYLMADGTPFQSQEGWQTMEYNQEFNGRDPRMAQTIAAPDYVAVGADASSKYYPSCKDYERSGYRPIKYFSDDTHDGATTSTTDYAIFRYGEVLLNYVEAKAELGQIDETIWNETVGELRKRAGVKNIYPASAGYVEDAWLKSYYGDPALSNTMLEIRRERVTELICENLRASDLSRWACQNLIVDRGTDNSGWMGIYVTADEYKNGIQFNGETYKFNASKVSQFAYKTGTSTADQNLTLSEGDHGYLIYNYRLEWNDRDYVRPIPSTALTKNPNLGQNYGWED